MPDFRRLDSFDKAVSLGLWVLVKEPCLCGCALEVGARTVLGRSVPDRRKGAFTCVTLRRRGKRRAGGQCCKAMTRGQTTDYRRPDNGIQQAPTEEERAAAREAGGYPVQDL